MRSHLAQATVESNRAKYQLTRCTSRKNVEKNKTIIDTKYKDSSCDYNADPLDKVISNLLIREGKNLAGALYYDDNVPKPSYDFLKHFMINDELLEEIIVKFLKMKKEVLIPVNQ